MHAEEVGAALRIGLGQPSPRGGAFQYTLTSTSAKLDRKPLSW